MCQKYGQLNFDQMPTPGWEVVISVLENLEGYYIYKIKGIWRLYLGNLLKKFYFQNRLKVSSYKNYLFIYFFYLFRTL